MNGSVLSIGQFGFLGALETMMLTGILETCFQRASIFFSCGADIVRLMSRSITNAKHRASSEDSETSRLMTASRIENVHCLCFWVSSN